MREKHKFLLFSSLPLPASRPASSHQDAYSSLVLIEQAWLPRDRDSRGVLFDVLDTDGGIL